MEDKLSEDKKEELRNIFCYLYYNDELTNVVPAKLSSFDFNLKMQQFYLEHEKIKINKPNLYKNALKRWKEKQLKYFNNNINLMGFKELTKNEFNKIK